LTTGVISAEIDNFNGVKGKNVFQTEAGLNRGNSGGPVLDNEEHMVGVNTAIARVAPDGLPITSISFSLKSSVATKWLREQGVGTQSAEGAVSLSAPTKASADVPVTPSLQPQAKPVQPPKVDVPAKPTVKPDVAQTGLSRSYNLDELISDRAKAEVDLENMISEMRGRMKGR